MENIKKNCFGYLTPQNTCTAVGYFKSCGFKKKLKFDCSEFGAIEINRAMNSIYINYQSLRVFIGGCELSIFFVFRWCFTFLAVYHLNDQFPTGSSVRY